MNKRTHQIKGDSKSLADLRNAVFQQWAEFDHETLSRTEGLLMAIYRSVLLHGGDNQYTLPHSSVNKRQQHGQDPVDRFVPRNVYLSGVEARDRLDNPVLPADDVQNEVD